MGKPKILAVDDEQSFMDIVLQYFEPRGYDTDVASDGVTGLELFKEKRHDVVLLDLKMVGLNGDEVMQEIFNMGGKPKIIFITAFSDEGKTQARLKEEGAYAFVEKPVTSLKSLEDLINEAANAE